MYIDGRTEDATTSPVTTLTKHTDTKTMLPNQIARVDQMLFAILLNNGGMEGQIIITDKINKIFTTKNVSYLLP